MTTPNVPLVDDRPFPFMSLHAELRQIVYHEVFSSRSIILNDKVGGYGCTGPHWQFCLNDGCDTDDDVIPLLQTSKQILAEAQPIFQRYTPTKLILGKNVRRQPCDLYKDELSDNALPYQHVTCLSLNVKCLGANPKYRSCPGPPGNGPGNVMRFDNLRDWSWDGNEKLPRDPERYPDLNGLHRVSQFFSYFPALREIHIYDVLKFHLDNPSFACPCPIKGMGLCTCEKCECVCVVCPSLPTSPRTSIMETRDVLYKALLARFRAALPDAKDSSHFRKYSDYCAVLEPLAYGVHFFLEEEIFLTIPIEQGNLLHKGLWRARYHLTHPESAKSPAQVPAEAAETRQQYKLRKEREEEEEKMRWREEQGLDPEPRDLSRFLLDFDILSEICSHREVSEELIGRPLVEFEAGLELELVNEPEFDMIMRDARLECHKARLEERHGKFWQWN